MAHYLSHRLLLVWALVRQQARPDGRDEQGDVPGWVLVTIMTAGLVAVLWAVAGDLLTQVFSSAIQDTVGGP